MLFKTSNSFLLLRRLFVGQNVSFCYSLKSQALQLAPLRTRVRFGNELIFLFAPSLLQLLEGSLILSYYFCFNCTSTGVDYLYTFVKDPR